MSARTLIKGGCVLSLDRSVGNHDQADVLIDSGVIAEVGPGIRARDAEVVDASSAIVLPGFVDTHRHTQKSLFKNLGRPMEELSSTITQHYEPDDVYVATLIGLVGASETGITTVVDWCDAPIEDQYSEAVLQAHRDAGIRTVLVRSRPSWEHGDGDLVSALRGLTSMSKDDPAALTTVALGSSELSAGLGFSQKEWELARELGIRIHAHAGKSTADRGVIADLASRGMLAEDVTLVHCTNLNDADFDGIASSSARVAVTPSSEMAEGLGSPPLQNLIDRGIRPGLGVDNEQTAPGDLFAQMRAANSLQHAALFDLKLAGKAGIPQLLSTRDVIRYATVDGAGVAGLGDVTGSLQPGKQADVIVLRTDRPNIHPINDPIGAVVWGMDTSNVDWVFVAGRALMRHGALEFDVDRVREMAERSQKRVSAAAGLMTDAPTGATS